MTKIEWVRADDGSEGMSWNALRAERIVDGKTRSVNHCEHVNEACRFCYAEKMNFRHGGLAFKPGHRKDYRFFVDRKKLLAPMRLKKPTRIFVESMSDAFGDWWPNEFIDQLYAVMALCPQHTFINLSKRPARRLSYRTDPLLSVRLSELAFEIGNSDLALAKQVQDRIDDGLPNVVEGTSVSCQAEADEFVPILLKTPAACRALSCEPLLGPIELWHLDEETQAPRGCGVVIDGGRTVGTPDNPPEGFDSSYFGLDWIIVGGESGQNARPMNPEWVRGLRDQCLGICPFFFKQWGEWATRPGIQEGDHGFVDDGGRGVTFVRRVGKKAAGRLLDGREWNEMPETKRAAHPSWQG